MTHSEQTEKKIILLKLKVYALIELASIEVECLFFFFILIVWLLMKFMDLISINQTICPLCCISVICIFLLVFKDIAVSSEFWLPCFFRRSNEREHRHVSNLTASVYLLIYHQFITQKSDAHPKKKNPKELYYRIQAHCVTLWNKMLTFHNIMNHGRPMPATACLSINAWLAEINQDNCSEDRINKSSITHHLPRTTMSHNAL